MEQVLDFFSKLFASSDWPPRWHCGKWTEFHGWLYIISDLLIWSAYFTIPIVIIRYVSRKKSIQFTSLYFLFAAFILACGATHFLDAAAFWLPVYRLSALVRFITGVVSWVTVFFLVKYLPVIFSLRSQAALEAEITQRQSTEQALKKSRKDYELLIGGVKDYAIFMLDADGKVASWNSGAELIKGYTAAEIIGKPMRIFYTPEQLQRDEPGKNLQHALQHGKYETEGWRVRKDGTLFWADIVFTALYDEDKQFYGYAKITRDITEKRKAEEQMLLLASIASNIQDAVISTDNDGIITRWNHAAELLLGWEADELVGKAGTEILKIDYLQTSRESVAESFNEKKYWQGEVVYHTKSGTPLNVLVTVSQLLNAKGNITGNLALVRDITERKKTEDKLKEFEYFFNNSNDLSCIANNEGYFEIVNPGFTRMLGYSQTEMSVTPFLNLVHPDDVAITIQVYNNVKSGEPLIHFTNRYRKFDGSYLLLDWNCTPNATTGKIYCIARDITARKKAEDALIKLNEVLEQKVEERTKEINKNAKRFRALIENNNDIISLMDDRFAVVYRSPSAARITGWQDEELLHIDGTKNIHPDDRDNAAAIIKELKANHGKTINTLFRNQHKNGHYLWLEGSVTNLLQDENVNAIVFNFRDVSDRMAAEAKLADSERRFRLLIENSADGIDLSDEFSNNIYRSPGALKITGDLPKENQMMLTHPDDLELVSSQQALMLANPGIPIPFQGRFRHALGHYIWIEGTLTNLMHVEGVHAFVTNFRDISERKQLEVLLNKANTLARIGGWEIDLVKGTVYWSDITRQIHETANDYVPDLSTGIQFYKEGPGRDLITQKVKEAIESGKSWDVELQIVTAKKHERWIRSIGETEFADGKCIRIYGSFQDIDDRKRSEIEQERLTERLQLATQSAQLGLWDWDVKINKLVWDEGMYRLYNLTENEFTTVYDGWASRVHPEDRHRVDRDIQLALEGKKEYNPEFRIVWKDASVHYIKASAYIEKDSEGNLVRMTGFNWDITEQKKAEQAILESEEKFRETFERISDGFVAVDNNWNYTYMNKKAAEITRQDPQNIVGKNLWKQFPNLVGSPFYKAYHQAMEKQENVYLQEFYPASDQWFENHIYPSPVGLSVYFTDITERKKAEEKVKFSNIELEEKVANRTEELRKVNEELEAFSYSVSHDLRAPLRSIVGFTSILEEDYADKLDDEARRITGIIKNNTLKMGNLIDDLLSFSRLGRQQIVKTILQTEQMVKEIVSEINVANGTRQIKWLIEKLPDTAADHTTIRHVWVNLLSNAVKYSNKQQDPVIEVGSMPGINETIFFVKDNGVGFDEKFSDKLFKVFQRLHSTADFEGTGVGLAIVEKIVTRHAGKVWAKGTPGEGASFFFSLPNEVVHEVNTNKL